MDKVERNNYTAEDFGAWREAGSLALTPKFQRRSVWTNAARSYLIDTILRGLPVPPIYLRVTQDSKSKRAVREVVDGQQRLNALLWYVDGDYRLSRTLPGPWAGKAYGELSEQEQTSVRQYSFNSEVLYGVSDSEVLEIFARLNTYSIRLNAQELRNGKFFGLFKQSAYSLAFEHVEFWRRSGVFSDAVIARMLEVELTSELMIAGIDGLQDKKASIDRFYARFDDGFPERSEVESQFRATIDEINEALAEVLPRSAFRRVPLFYTLYTAIFHRRFGLPGLELPSPRRRLNENERRGLRSALAELDDALSTRLEETEEVSRPYGSFVEASLRQTDNIAPRRVRLTTLYDLAF